jgi:hypothetical protein
LTGSRKNREKRYLNYKYLKQSIIWCCASYYPTRRLSNTKRETGPIPADELAGLASAIEVESVKFILQFIPKFVEN